MRRLNPATGLWKIQPQWVVTPGKQTNNIVVIKSRREGLAVHVARTQVKENAWKIVAGN
jgi:hypothetical protein